MKPRMVGPLRLPDAPDRVRGDGSHGALDGRDLPLPDVADHRAGRP
jgi:hypothetical protein